jgi:hypothetical protein
MVGLLAAAKHAFGRTALEIIIAATASAHSSEQSSMPAHPATQQRVELSGFRDRADPTSRCSREACDLFPRHDKLRNLCRAAVDADFSRGNWQSEKAAMLEETHA